MNRSKLLWSLAVLNLMLAIVLLVRLAPQSSVFAQARRPSDYLMIPATIQGGTNGVVYVIDTSNGMLSATSFNDARRSLDPPMPPIDLSRVFDNRGGVAPPRGVVPPR
jgi:hypothetical protein